MESMYDDAVEVVENRPLTGGHFILSLYSPRQAQAARPGQFAMVRLLGRSDVLLRRPMSIYDVAPDLSADVKQVLSPEESGFGVRGSGFEERTSPASSSANPKSQIANPDSSANPESRTPSPGSFPRPELRIANPDLSGEKAGATKTIVQLLYKVVGRGTRLMAELKPGDRVGMLAPLGHGFFEEEYLDRARAADEILHVAGGIGIAALLLPARQLAGGGLRQRLFFGGRTQDDLAGLDKFDSVVDEIVLATEDGSRGYRGFVTGPLQEYLAVHRGKKFLMMVCGPWAMLEASVKLAKRYGQACLVSMENRMGCGLGVCLGCSIRVDGTGHAAYERVCTEGPVFWAEKVIWQKEALPL